MKHFVRELMVEFSDHIVWQYWRVNWMYFEEEENKYFECLAHDE